MSFGGNIRYYKSPIFYALHHRVSLYFIARIYGMTYEIAPYDIQKRTRVMTHHASVSSMSERAERGEA